MDRVPRLLPAAVACAGLLLCAIAPASAQSTTATGVSRALNPAISLNSLILAQISDGNDEVEHNRIALQETELQLSSIVDPFWRADVTLAFERAHGHDDEDEGDGFGIDIEEAFIEGRRLPAGLGLRVGRFYVPFGKHAPLHTHRFPFVEAPRAITAFLGEHAPIETGVELQTDLPLPWFAELTAYAVDGESASFDAEDRDPAYGARLSNLWDVGDDGTIELGASTLMGPDASHPGEKMDARFHGVDLTYRWISSRSSRGPALTLGAELVLPDPEEGSGDPVGWYALAQYRVRPDWWLGATVGAADAGLDDDHDGELEMDGHDHGFEGDIREYKINLTFAPSEFSAVRAEVARYEDRLGDGDETRFSLQWNITIGSHPAHRY